MTYTPYTGRCCNRRYKRDHYAKGYIIYGCKYHDKTFYKDVGHKNYVELAFKYGDFFE